MARIKRPTRDDQLAAMFTRIDALESGSCALASRMSVIQADDKVRNARLDIQADRMGKIESDIRDLRILVPRHVHLNPPSMDQMRKAAVGGSNIFQMAEEIGRQYKQDQLVELIKQLAGKLNL